MEIWIILGIVVVLGLYVMVTYNSFVSLDTQVEEGFSTMDVYLQKRYDLIPNLVETVKGYAAHEKETLSGVVEARAKAVSAKTPNEKIAAESEFSGVLGRLMAITENYPTLQANTNFLDLQAQLKTMETEIASSRKYYNGVVKVYNVKVRSIPSNIVASMFKFTEKEMFEITTDAARENVKVSF